MPAGGKRAGSGRKPGAAWKGKEPRPKPLRDMARARVQQVLNTASDPLAVLVEIANDRENDVQVRVQAATAACPFMFPRLSAAIVATAPASARDDTAQLVERVMRRLERIAPPPATIEGAPVMAGAAE